jgi:hypothetical protein
MPPHVLLKMCRPHIHHLLGKLGHRYINAEVRHRYDMTQREARGRWTIAEASSLIDRLRKDVEDQAE